MLFRSKCIYKLLDSYDIPNNLWIKGHILCAKTLVKDNTSSNYHEVIKMLRELCQILPPLPLLLNKKYSIRQDLILDTEPGIDSNIFEAQPIITSEKSSQDSKTGPHLSIIQLEMSNYARETLLKKKSEELKEDKCFLSENNDKYHVRKCSTYMQQMMIFNDSMYSDSTTEKKVNRRMRSIKPSIGYLPKGIISHDDSMRSGENENKDSELFSSSTQWDYLYLMGKIAIKHDINVKFGIRTLCDLIGLLGLFLYENTQLGLKTKYWIAYGLHKIEKISEASNILSKIVMLVNEEKLKIRVKELLGKCQLSLKIDQ